MRKLGIFLVVVLLMLAVRADFHDLSLSVTVKINTNGSAHVTERVRLTIDPSSVDIYNRSMYSRNLTIMDWQQITNSKLLRQHIFSPVSVSNMKVVPENLNNYSFSTASAAVIKLDYELEKFVPINQTGPRTVLYAFNKSSFSFEHSPSGQILPQDTELTIIIPPDSIVTSISPDPDEPSITRDYLGQVMRVSNFTWRGTIPLMDFELTFTREEPIGVEVSRFFEDIEMNALSFILSTPGIILTLLVLIAVVYITLPKR
ncbi:MAG: hypothetical protein NT130_02085 [Candidatus Micrarchaeota archaeon]|nr:hypothetical protein [Candidatus Micrarchaeota archaeon]